MANEFRNNYDWSDWYRFDDAKLLATLPDEPGVYEVRTDFEIGRLCGSSSLVTIGRAKNLKERRYKQKVGEATRYLNRAEKWLLRANHTLEFRYCTCRSFDEAKCMEAIRQLEYESQHWELPPGNDHLELAPVKRRIKELLSIGVEQMVLDLLRGKLDIMQVATKLHLSATIIDNLIVYFGFGSSNR
jgi:hypothetical protein